MVSINDKIIKRYLDLRNGDLLNMIFFIDFIRNNNNITSEQELLDLLLSPGYSEVIRRTLQYEYKEYIKSPEKYLNQIPKGIKLFK